MDANPAASKTEAVGSGGADVGGADDKQSLTGAGLVEALADDQHSGPADAADSTAEMAALVAAGRLEARMASRPAQMNAPTGDVVAWSVDNLLAIVDCASHITLVHLSAPHRANRIAIQERPYLLQFSPRGDALFAAFRGSKMSCLWTRASQALNDWKRKQTWMDWPGRVLGLHWLGGNPRQWSTSFARRPARGPQFAAEQATRAVGGLVVCEGGQLVLFHGSIEEEELRVVVSKMAIPAEAKIAHAAIGLVADEPLALVAYTMRMKSKSTSLRGATAGGDALGMFFDGADDVVGLNKQQSQYFDDGQDKIELMEVRFDIATNTSTFALRPLSPLYVASYEHQSLPSTSSLSQLMWIEGDEKAGGQAASAAMKLFGAFYAHGNTTLRSWDLHREEFEPLSDAFAKLEAAKARAGGDEKEDWFAKSCTDRDFSNYMGSHFQATPAGQRMLCLWMHAPAAPSLSSVSKVRVEQRLVDVASLQVLEDVVLQYPSGCSSTPALSPNGVLAAMVVDHKVSIVQTSREARWSPDNGLIYKRTMLQRQDRADLLRACPCDVETVGSTIDGGSYPKVIRMMELGAQIGSGRSVRAKNSLLVLELVHCFSKLNSSDRGGYFEYSQLWTILSLLEWVVWLLETLARQAYLAHADATVSSPPPAPAGSGIENEADVLALMTHAFPRQLLTQSIMRLVRFSNWLLRLNRSKDEVKKMVASEEFSASYTVINRRTASDGGGLWSLADNLRLAQMRINEVKLKSAIDLSQAGRILKAYTDQGTTQAGTQWWAALETGDRAKMAQALVDGQCIRTALALFCSPDDEDKTAPRDILTKAQLDPKTRRLLCLACQSQTQRPLRLGDACLCSSQSWWSVER